VAVPDPYRWLEELDSPETKSWVEAENKVTFAYLDKIPFRAQLNKRLNALYNYAKYSSPSRRGENYFFSKNDGLQNQSVLYIQKGLTGTPEVLIDPNKWSEDGTERLRIRAVKRRQAGVFGVQRAARLDRIPRDGPDDARSR
jgi:prolyl oligopeptidase